MIVLSTAAMRSLMNIPEKVTWGSTGYKYTVAAAVANSVNCASW